MPDKEHQGDPGSWQQEWDRRSHTPDEFRQEIRGLRDRIRGYLKEIEALNKIIDSMREELVLNDKYWRKMMDEKSNK
jgi:predicted RNase H-like nuclease (RuvC/YqgF family)